MKELDEELKAGSRPAALSRCSIQRRPPRPAVQEGRPGALDSKPAAYMAGDFCMADLAFYPLIAVVFILCIRIVLVLSLFVIVLEFSLGIIINTCKED